ncbi:hypothetical protein SAMN06264364_1266 [Quadrisphaera granulorum]|uniref:Polyhydroxyalkanoate synthesis regulator phasin n=1 Tax=Quadrisphaera granulorum TaxID=317664 RepID=A0A315ZXK9_9ACTN|nr:hypothetical protein [Quadrisphaera granulorum]PWJ49254.1 hypothetical protein BXY45_1266 [Quadrisphaera granulorum]SZE98171.1 hypothetical protein SAMN06264364_1266 [Quadrisphaera granulorum]
MTFEGLRSYAQAANDLSAIARGRLLEAVREAVRSEIERAGAAVGLATAEEVAALRRSVDRLQRRVSALEGTPPGSEKETRTTTAAASEAPAARPARRPSAARARATARGGVGSRPPVGAPHSTRPSSPAAPPPAPEEAGSATVSDAPESVTGTTSSSGTRPQRRSAPSTPRRRSTTAASRAEPKKTEDDATEAPASKAHAEPETTAQASAETKPAAGTASGRVTPVRRPRKPAVDTTAAEDSQDKGGSS